jgi:aspartyl-tRNA(Asn)/glutamyl-tRNA(Gln) amidotransferase subunit A
MMNLHDLTCTEAAAGIRRGDFSPLELVDALLARIESTEPDLQAWEVVDAEGARRAARAMTLRQQERAEQPPLFGVPLGIKDIFDVQGIPTSANFDPYRNRVATKDSAVVAHLRAAGAIMLGKTVTVQFATAFDSPKSRNPWNLARSPGGSSSGSAAAVGARQVPGATGTQTGGSILRPAAFCGAVGLKPSFGRMSRHAVLPVSWSFDHPGFITRSVADAALLLQTTAFHDPCDPFSAVQQPEDFVTAATRPTEPPVLAVVMDMLDYADPGVRAATEATIHSLSAAGATIREVRLPADMETLLGIHFLIRVTENAAIHAAQYRAMPEPYEPNLRANIELGMVIPAWLNVHAARLRRRYRQEMERLFDGVDALIGPTFPALPPVVADGIGNPALQVIWSLFGMPNISIPTGVGAEGLPHGMQFIAPCFGERTMFRAAAWAESLLAPLPLAPLATASRPVPHMV